jgi:hypothetical protein
MSTMAEHLRGLLYTKADQSDLQLTLALLLLLLLLRLVAVQQRKGAHRAGAYCSCAILRLLALWA